MKLVVAGGGVAGVATSLALARAGHEAVVLERDRVHPGTSPGSAFDVERRGIPHYFQPHAFPPRGRRSLADGLRTSSTRSWTPGRIRKTWR